MRTFSEVQQEFMQDLDDILAYMELAIKTFRKDKDFDAILISFRESSIALGKFAEHHFKSLKNKDR